MTTIVSNQNMYFIWINKCWPTSAQLYSVWTIMECNYRSSNQGTNVFFFFGVRPIACISYASKVGHIKPKDRWTDQDLRHICLQLSVKNQQTHLFTMLVNHSISTLWIICMEITMSFQSGNSHQSYNYNMGILFSILFKDTSRSQCKVPNSRFGLAYLSEVAMSSYVEKVWWLQTCLTTTYAIFMSNVILEVKYLGGEGKCYDVGNYIGAVIFQICGVL